MSMTKRYLESLPADEQDNILGLPHDEWTDDAENEPTDAKREWFDARLASLLADITEEAEEELAELEWARALMEEDEPNDPMVKCPDCQLEEKETMLTTTDYLKAQIAKAERDIAHGVGNRESKEKRLAALRAVLAREDCLMVKPEGPCVTLTDNNGVEWKL